MTWPIPGVRVGTPYGRRGRSWSCQKDPNGLGVHTGDDFPAAAGTRVYAPISGQIRHRNYGPAFGKHQFAISPDPDQPFGSGEVFFAHTRTRPSDSIWVEVGDFIAEVGSEGNTTGPHLHAEWHPASKNVWNCSVSADPTLIWEYTVPKYTTTIYSNKLGYGEPTNGDDSSDTVKELQYILNVPQTGRYDDATDVVVRKWQVEVCHDVADPPGQSYLGPSQRGRMFVSPPYTVKDVGLPAIATGAPPVVPPPTLPVGTTLGKYLADKGFVVHDVDVPYGREATWLGVEYIMVHHTASPDTTTAASDAAWIRTGTGYPPLAQLMLDRDGEVWICAQERAGQPVPGRASHAGRGSGYGIPDDTMNERSLGLEVCNDGTKPISSDVTQYSVMISLLDHLSDYFDVPPSKVIGHKEWSSTGKPDPLDDMVKVRTDVAAGGITLPFPPDGGYITLEEADARYALKNHDHDSDYADINHTHPPTVPPPSGGGNARIWTDYSGKPTKPQIMLADSTWRLIDGIACDDPPIAGSEHHMLYVRLNFRWKSANLDMAKVEVRYVREGGDATAYDERHYDNKTASVPFQQIHFEEGEAGRGGRWYMKFHGGISSVELTTRYSKVHVIAVV